MDHLVSFKDHKVEYKRLDEDTELLVWAIPGRKMYSITYLCRDGILYVSGDYGSAIYRWTEPNSLKWIAGCDLGYFSSKCQASPSGTGFMRWDGERAKEILEDELRENPMEADLDEWEDKIKHLRSSLYSENELIAFLYDYSNREFLEAVFGVNYTEFFSGIGERLDEWCEIQWQGLKEAMKQLENANEKVTA